MLSCYKYWPWGRIVYPGFKLTTQVRVTTEIDVYCFLHGKKTFLQTVSWGPNLSHVRAHLFKWFITCRGIFYTPLLIDTCWKIFIITLCSRFEVHWKSLIYIKKLFQYLEPIEKVLEPLEFKSSERTDKKSKSQKFRETHLALKNKYFFAFSSS